MDTVLNYLTKVRVDNAWHDYTQEVGQRIQDRVLDKLGITQDAIDNMSADQWAETYDRLEKEEASSSSTPWAARSDSGHSNGTR